MLHPSSLSSAVSLPDRLPAPRSWCPAVPLNIRAGMNHQSGMAAAWALMCGCNVPSQAWHTAAGPPHTNVEAFPKIPVHPTGPCMEGTACPGTSLLAPLPHPSSSSTVVRLCPCPFPKHGPRRRWKPGGIGTDMQQSCFSPPWSLDVAGGGHLRLPQLASERGACTPSRDHAPLALRGCKAPGHRPELPRGSWGAPPRVPGSSPRHPQASSPPCSRPTRHGAGIFHLGSFIPGSAGAAEPVLELTESHIRARDGDPKAAHHYFIIRPDKDTLA